MGQLRGAETERVVIELIGLIELIGFVGLTQ